LILTCKELYLKTLQEWDKNKSGSISVEQMREIFRIYKVGVGVDEGGVKSAIWHGLIVGVSEKLGVVITKSRKKNSCSRISFKTATKSLKICPKYCILKRKISQNQPKNDQSFVWAISFYRITISI
jgi:hypothetical protein